MALDLRTYQCWILDDTFTIIGQVNSVGGDGVDLHEVCAFQYLSGKIYTDQMSQCAIPRSTNATAMITVYNNIENFDLSAFGGPTNGTLIDCLIQEIDIATGSLLFNWRWVDMFQEMEAVLSS